MSYIFIAHVEKDADIGIKIALGLEEAGYKTWCYEVDSVPGPSYIVRTGESVAQSQAVVVVISPHSLGSNQVTKEIVRAHESSKQFIPILRDITHAEFQQRQPEWREAIGSATSIRIPQDGIEAVIPLIIEGVKLLGIRPSSKADSERVGRLRKALDEIPAHPVSQEGKIAFTAKPREEIKKPKSGKLLLIILSSILVIAIVVVVILLTRGGNKDQDHGLTSNLTSTTPVATGTSTPSVTPKTTLTETTKPTLTPTPEPTPPPVVKPDFTILDIAWSPENPSAGEPVTFTVAVTNQGKTDADASYLYFFVDGAYKESVQVEKISAGATTTKTFNWTAQLGTHVIKCTADKTDLVNEIDEANNEKESTLPITLQPDLVIKDITFTPTNPSAPGMDITAMVTVQNQGNGTAAPSSLECSYPDYNPYKKAILHNVLSVPAISAGGTATLSIVFDYGGYSSFIAIADCNNVLPESDENNNSKTTLY